ncbi:hypothetical protein D3C81_984450 [compost metagenome]
MFHSVIWATEWLIVERAPPHAVATSRLSCAYRLLTSIDVTALPVPTWIAVTICSISLVECCVLCANARTSSATTAKPRPASPARAASIAALSANRFVCSAILRMTLSTPLMLCTCSAKPFISDVVSETAACNCPMTLMVSSTCCFPRSADRLDSFAATLACSAFRATSSTAALI